MSFRKAYRFYLYVSCSIVLGGCSLILTRPHEPTFEHKVRFKGQTLPLVSSWYTGTPKNAQRIKKLNSFVSSELRVGQEVLIPSRLLIRSAPLPKSFLRASLNSKSKPSATRVARSSKVSAAKESHLKELTYASPSSVIKSRNKSSGLELGEPEPNKWVGEEIERDSIQERILKAQN